jgi:hypothetical protein
MSEQNAPEITVETVCRIIVKARQFDAKEGPVDENDGGNAADEGFREVLAETADDPADEELKALIDGLNEDEQCELVALVWVGRGDFARDEWARAVAQAREQRNTRTAEYLLGTPLLADYLDEGLDVFGLSCEDFERQHL